MLAGQDTTANGLSAVLYELAANPATQQRLVEEVDAFPGGRLPEYDDIPQHFKYAEAAFQVWRWFGLHCPHRKIRNMQYGYLRLPGTHTAALSHTRTICAFVPLAAGPRYNAA